jgi:hypothetical protein
MSTRFEDISNGVGFDAIALTFGETVSYTAFGGSATDVTAVWEPDDIEPEDFDDSRQEMITGRLLTSIDDTTAPDSRDQFTIDTKVWAVKSIERQTPLVVWRLQRQIQHRVGGGNSRMDRGQ